MCCGRWTVDITGDPAIRAAFQRQALRRSRDSREETQRPEPRPRRRVALSRAGDGAKTFRELVTLVRRHREANGVHPNPGDQGTAVEIEQQLCAGLPEGWSY